MLIPSDPTDVIPVGKTFKIKRFGNTYNEIVDIKGNVYRAGTPEYDDLLSTNKTLRDLINPPAKPGAHSGRPNTPERPNNNPLDNVDLDKFSSSDRRAYRSYDRLIAEHLKKIEDFKANPTVRPGMEDQPIEVIRAQQEARIRHLETEIKTFRQNQQNIIDRYK